MKKEAFFLMILAAIVPSRRPTWIEAKTMMSFSRLGSLSLSVGNPNRSLFNNLSGSSSSFSKIAFFAKNIPDNEAGFALVPRSLEEGPQE